MDSNFKSHNLHFVLFPFMAQGHMIPMVDIGKLLAQQGIKITIITTPLNAKRFQNTWSRAIESGLQIQFVPVEFPGEVSGLPKHCENIDMLPSLGLGNEFFQATNLLKHPVENLLLKLSPSPNCIISDMTLPYTAHLAQKLNVPRIVFNGFSCFCKLFLNKLYSSRVLETIKSDFEYFAVPDLPDHIELTKNQLPGAMIDMGEFKLQVSQAEMVTYGVLINTFEEMESAYVKEFKKVRNNKAWCIGPVSLCNKTCLDRSERGNKPSDQESECLEFLDSQNEDSVLYVCFGSLCNLVTCQLIELALGLEESKRPFIWVIRDQERSKELETWFGDGNFEEKVKGRGLIIRGWAPQVVILSHKAVGGFLTHCGWNSTLEGITAGVPLATWPLFADQFINERLVSDVLKTGVKVGSEVTVKWGEEDKSGVLIAKENIKNAIDKLMGGGQESEERRQRAKELSKMAKEAMEENGSSYLNIKLFIQDILQQQQQQSMTNGQLSKPK